jgi:hypothetical protein
VLLAFGENEAPSPLQFSDFRGHLVLEDERLTFSSGHIRRRDGIYSISGTATLDRVLSIRLSTAGASVYAIEGSLTQPHVLYTGPSSTPLPPKAGELSRVVVVPAAKAPE